MSGVRIHEKLLEEGVTAKYRTLSEYIRKLKGKQKICIRFHSVAGEEAQVDFGYVGMLHDSSGKAL